MLDEKAKAARRAYHREWQKKNPDKVRAQQERYWRKKAAAAAAAEETEPRQQEPGESAPAPATN